MFDELAVSLKEADLLIAGVEWYHRIEILPGLITPGVIPYNGIYDAPAYLDSLAPDLPKDLSGARVLDIGAWDGALSFELHKRGASVVAADVQDPAKTGFNVLNRISGSKIPYRRCSVYDLSREFGAEFDFVIFMNVFSILKAPTLAYEAISSVMKVGATLFSDGTGQGFELRDKKGDLLPAEWRRAFGEMLDRLDDFGVAIMQLGDGVSGTGERYLPNRSAFGTWLSCAGFESTKIWKYRHTADGRTAIGATAVKVGKPEIVEHRLVGEANPTVATPMVRS